MRVKLNKIASATRNASLAFEVRLSDEIVAEEGYILAGRLLGRKENYNELEDVHGRMVKLKDGDLIAGVLGARKGLRGYSGYVPASVKPGDRLSLLNLGGVIGKCESSHLDLGEPLAVEVLGSVLTFPSIDERIGVPAHIRKGSVAWADEVGPCPPVIFVSGTCMNTGKTTACAEIIRELSRRGHRVVGAKLTGVSLLRDTLQMEDSGAVKALNFTDAGVASTANEKVVPIAKGILKTLMNWDPGVFVVELGDGLAGEYGVADLLEEPELAKICKAHVVCAADPVAAYGAARMFQERFLQPIAVMTGPVTDNDVGKNYARQTLGIPAWNARSEYGKLVDFLERRIREAH